MAETEGYYHLLREQVQVGGRGEGGREEGRMLDKEDEVSGTLRTTCCGCVYLFQTLSQSLNQTEEAKQLLQTAKTMLEALQQAIDLLKDSQLSESDISQPASTEATPPPLDFRQGPLTALVRREGGRERERGEGGGEKGEIEGRRVEEREERGR